MPLLQQIRRRRSQATGAWRAIGVPRQQRYGPGKGERHNRQRTPSAGREGENDGTIVAVATSTRTYVCAEVMAARRWADRVTLRLYGWFAKGFDTAALQEAKALLEELTG